MPLGPILERVTDLRFTSACDWYTRVGGRVAANHARAGALTAAAVVARAAAHEESTSTSPEPSEAPATPEPHGVLAALARGMEAGIALEQWISTPIAMIPFPGFPALRVQDIDVGLPHAHNHPPNLIPPNPVPMPLPSAGPVIPIPILSGASRTLINNRPAARCGDLGLAIFCGGFFPMFEIFFGSANTWIEGARASRLAIDMTKHCTFSAPKPSDPPLGPMIGTTVAVGSPNVMIGGVPMPSLLNLAIAQAFKGAFKALGAAFRRATARSLIARLLRSGQLAIHGSPTYVKDVIADLEKIASTRSGREMLDRFRNTWHVMDIGPYGGAGLNATAAARDWDFIRRGVGSDSVIEHSPDIWANHASGPHPAPGTSSDAILFHEMNHATNNAEGASLAQNTQQTHGWDQRWQNNEEYQTVHAENGYRQDTGLPTRDAYTNPFP